MVGAWILYIIKNLIPLIVIPHSSKPTFPLLVFFQSDIAFPTFQTNLFIPLLYGQCRANQV
ncbi:MAG TPA: hypothetical protein DD827_05780 [Gammaproteobacteria bacterium]|nr:hypothetical protein [Gammaproteobacteria bacterium]